VRKGFSVNLDPTGMCGYREPSGEKTSPVVIDLGTSKSVEVNGVTDFAWLSD
jgi:hypothetical protein